jgi:hypothetical protein
MQAEGVLAGLYVTMATVPPPLLRTRVEVLDLFYATTATPPLLLLQM